MLTLAALSLLSVATAQKVGSETAESHPSFTWTKCTGPGACETIDTEVVIDSNWRWTHGVDSMENCYDGNDWTDVCSSNDDCAENCVIEGADYEGTYGASTSGDALTLKFVTEHEYGKNVGSRLYLLEDPDTYQMFDLIGNEFTFDVDLSTVACGMNSALYFVAMEPDGGMSSYPANEAGAHYGTGYCDAQCARDLKWIGGQGNFEGWEPSSSDASAGVGKLGSCCAEIDVWESNSHSFALTPHACEVGNNGYHVCEDQDCGGTYSDDRYAGHCDANGCDYNPFRMGNKDFYGAGKTLDTTKPFTVVTQFEAQNLHQFFIQDGTKIEIPGPTWSGLPADSSDINPALCDALFDVFEEDTDRYADVGGWTAMEEALSLPMVLVMSIWADHYANMLWLDGLWPRDAPEDQPGALRGDCPADSGVPDEVIEEHADAYVTWSNIRFGPIGSTTDV
ncbi:Exoglucanase-like protein [Hapsidospora chrysogenum ATCC 11550]|uniref:Glucanase n=1 Tax=Hapsidospora chrysogenum (strain ATCC 11550 / CBS 779.69 / DSM 880 / IAM 14645 / JCM 23072 / IMI 49137) TaxID=857340 RepID=A0A086T3X5_HAPC1|nr:Exoglucanase-like protein [Hapsidospora chrysogenum ATCC 11550]